MVMTLPRSVLDVKERQEKITWPGSLWECNTSVFHHSISGSGTQRPAVTVGILSQYLGKSLSSGGLHQMCEGKEHLRRKMHQCSMDAISWHTLSHYSDI